MTAPQPGILAPVPDHARYLEFVMTPDEDHRGALARLAELGGGHGTVVGLGANLIAGLGRRIAGLRPFPAAGGPGCTVPSTQADLWCWLRGGDRGELTNRARAVINMAAPAFRIDRLVDGFKYGRGLDLTGYEDGTENPEGDAALKAAILDDAAPALAGSSFVAVQRWVHDLDRFKALATSERNDIIGRRLSDNEELADAPPSAHVKRTAQESFDLEAFLVRRSMPWSDGAGAGLMFVAFGRSFDAFEAQLARMTGREDGTIDALFRFTRPVTGGYFWCPPVSDGSLNLAAAGPIPGAGRFMGTPRPSRQALFHTHIVVDWSARSKPSPARPCKDSIWWAVARGGDMREPEYARTRHDAIERLAMLAAGELDADRRVLVGFDFLFGYPAGVARHVTGTASALALRDWLDERIEDEEDNANNRYDIAAEINRTYPGLGPFWGRPAHWPHPDVPTRASDRSRREGHPPERRIADRRAAGAKTVWQLAYAGSVGSQVLLGLPALKRLCAHPSIAGRAAIWPFETGLRAPDTPLAIAEVYPSLLRQEIRARKREGEIPDAAQVRVNAEAFARLDEAGGLTPLFEGAPDLAPDERCRIEREEAWILGLGHEDALRTR